MFEKLYKSIAEYTAVKQLIILIDELDRTRLDCAINCFYESKFVIIEQSTFDRRGGLFGPFLSNENDFAIMQKIGKEISQSKNFFN